MSIERPVNTADKVTSIDDVKSGISELVDDRLINRDQENILGKVLESADFALLANRALNQGTDPELLRRTLPDSVYAVAKQFGLSPEQADSAIEKAHKLGPGSLAKDSSEEWLWLILAKHSADEAKIVDDPAKMLAASARQIVAFEQYASSEADILQDAKEYREQILKNTQSIEMAPLGNEVPLYVSDLGFYAAYRSGYSVAAVRATNGLVFYGSDGSTSLEDQKISVDKVLSPYFGIVFPKKEAE